MLISECFWFASKKLSPVEQPFCIKDQWFVLTETDIKMKELKVELKWFCKQM